MLALIIVCTEDVDRWAWVLERIVSVMQEILAIKLDAQRGLEILECICAASATNRAHEVILASNKQ